ncbi:MAG TPA: pitrilysin family protein [Vicinamibacteria bacterium]|nr:pitrilysin family protein [Vicinamibacteria bacterium]
MRSRLPLSLALGLTAMTTTELAAQVLPFEATERTLPNGLTVIVVPTGFPNIVSLQIPVQTGSRNEVEAGKSGFAHFFEHMMFRGTAAFPPEKYQAAMTAAGARNNAYTTDDYTNYHVTFAKEDLEAMLRLEADRFQNLSYLEPAFKTEARAVLGEYNKNSADPLNKLIEVQRERAFTTHPYRHTTMGFLADIEDMPNEFEYAKAFFDRWYRPEYTTIIVAGDVTPEQVMPLVEKYWGSWRKGTYQAEIPAEPDAKGPVHAHVPWTSPTLPWVTVAFHGPAFSETEKDFAAVDLLSDLAFGPTSELYRRLVEEEQTVDRLFPYVPGNADPYLVTVAARVKEAKDAVAVRDAILSTFASLRAEPLPARRVQEAKSNARYSLIRGLDNTERIAALLARFVRYRRSFDSLNSYYALYDTLSAEDLQRAAGRYFVDAGLVVTTLAHDPLPADVGRLPALSSLAPGGAAAASPVKVIQVPSALPQVRVKLLFRAGSAHDPAGKEGLATLAAAMIAEAGSRERRIDEIRQALFPMAGSFEAQVDKEMTTFTASVHRDNWGAFSPVVLPMLLDPGFREEDFRRLKDAQHNALVSDLRSNNEEELGKERLQSVVFAGTPYGHPALGTVDGLAAITLDDVKDFVRRAYTRAGLTIGISGGVPTGFAEEVQRALQGLPEGPALPAPAAVAGRRPRGVEVDIVQKETRATAISFGHPIAVTRSHPDFAALSVARAWLGEHRSTMARLFSRIREARGMNYGDYAYIEAFPGGMFQFFPSPNLARRAQLFEVWIRPVAPENAHMALRIAVHELETLIREGLSEADFQAARNYMMKNVFLLTATQDQQLGYALDAEWYGIGEFTSYMRERLARLTRDDVNQAVRRHLSSTDLAVVMVARDAEALRQALVADAFSPITYDAEKPAELLAEDKVIGARKLAVRPEAVQITKVDEVFKSSSRR